jgi:hypothetical protein
MDKNEYLSFMQAEFCRVHDTLNRIEDRMGKRQDAQDARMETTETRVAKVEDATAKIIGGIKSISLITAVWAAIVAWAKWVTGSP